MPRAALGGRRKAAPAVLRTWETRARPREDEARAPHRPFAATVAPCRRSPASSCSRPLRRAAAVALVVGVVALQTDPVERRRARAQGAEGGAALDARARRARRSRGGRPSVAPRSSTRPASGSAAAQSFARLDSLEARVGQAFAALARRHGRPPEPPRRAASAGAQSSSSTSAWRSSGRALPGARGRLARGRGLRAGHGVRGGRRQPPPSRATRRACRSSSRRPRCRASSRA